MEFDAFLVQVLGFLRRGFAVNRTMFDFAVVHLACLLGKFWSDMIGVLGQVFTQFLELGAKFGFLRR